MQRITATIILMLAWCSVPVNHLSVAPMPSSLFSVELRLGNSPNWHGSDLVFSFRMGTGSAKTLSMDQSNSAHYFNSLREAAMDTVFKWLHMA